MKGYITEKKVVLCRSGKQIYSRQEVLNRLGSIPEKFADKDFFIEQRPASVIAAALDKCKNLTVTKEHPNEFVDSKNWSRLAMGYTGDTVKIVPLADNEIGIEVSLVLTTDEIYNYYIDNNKEVSLGYVSKASFVEEDNLGYDIILEEIVDVNHVAVTASGRGGSTVAILDSFRNLLGGLKPMKTGIFSFLKRGKATDKNAVVYSQTVFDLIEKATEKSKVEHLLSVVTDSVKNLKDSDDKEYLLNATEDAFSNLEEAKKYKEDLSKSLDSLYNKALEASIADFESKVSDSDEEKEKKLKKEAKEEKKEKNKGEEEDAEEEGEKGKKDGEKGEEEGDAKNSNTIMDSLADIQKQMETLTKSLDSKIDSSVKKALGLTENKKITTDSSEEFNSDDLDYLFD